MISNIKIKKLVTEKLYRQKLLREADMMSSIQEVLPIISYMISSGFITYHLGKILLKAYEKGKATQRDIEKIANSENPRALTLSFLMSGENIDIDDLEETVVSMQYDGPDLDATTLDIEKTERRPDDVDLTLPMGDETEEIETTLPLPRRLNENRKKLLKKALSGDLNDSNNNRIQ